MTNLTPEQKIEHILNGVEWWDGHRQISQEEAKQSILDLFIKLVEEQKTKIYNSNSRTTGIREEYIDRQALINSIKGE